MKSQNTQLIVARPQSFITRFAIFVQKREICGSALCCFKDCATTNLLTSEFKWFTILRERMMSPAVSAQV